jgi:hypothetical protein
MTRVKQGGQSSAAVVNLNHVGGFFDLKVMEDVKEMSSHRLKSIRGHRERCRVQ